MIGSSRPILCLVFVLFSSMLPVQSGGALTVQINIANNPATLGGVQTVTVTVLDPAGQPVPQAQVHLEVTYPSGQVPVQRDGQTDTGGSYSVTWQIVGLPENVGAYQVRVSATKEGYETGQADATFQVTSTFTATTTCSLSIDLASGKPSYVVGETVSLSMSSNEPADYVLTIKKPDGTTWASESGILPAIFTKKATQPTGHYTAELTASYCGSSFHASTSFSIVLVTYDVTISLSGLPTDLKTTLLVDGNNVADMNGSDVRVITYAVDTSHTFQIDQYVSGAVGYRYYCASNSWTVGAAESKVFNYVKEVRLDPGINPLGAGSLSLTPPSPEGWYSAGTQIQANVTVVTSGYLFTRWELDGTPVGAVQPYTIVMNAPHQLTAVFSVAGIVTTETATSFSTETTTEVIHTTTAVITETATSEATRETTPAIETTRSQSTNSQPPEGLSPLFMASILVAVVSVAALVATGISRLRRIHAVTPSPRICPHCGFSNPPYTSAFCVKCGNPLKASEP